MKLVLAAGLVVNFGLLAAFKYLAFFGSIIDGACAAVGIPLNLELPVWAAPIGISFYTLMAGSYLIDVFRGTVAPIAIWAVWRCSSATSLRLWRDPFAVTARRLTPFWPASR